MNIFSKEFILFWAAVILTILMLVPFFNNLPFLWFFIFCAGAAALIYGTFFMGKRVLKDKKEKEIESQKIEKITENIYDAVIMYDENFRIMAWNKASENLFGISKKDILGKIISPEKISDSALKIIVQIIFPSLAPSVFKKSLPGEYPQIMDISFPDPILELTTFTERVLSSDNKFVFFKIIKNRTREIELSRSKSEFITVAAHQLRTPLTAVYWIFETLSKSESISDSDRELIADGIVSSSKSLKIVNDLLDVSKIESGKFGYSFAKFDLVLFIKDLLKNANILAKKYGVSVYFDSPKESIEIYGDAQKLGIAFSNIIDNAIRYNTKNGQVIVKIELYPDRPYVQTTIKDTGLGISKENLKKLFTKFFRGDNVLKEHTDGSGIGLYVSRNIILRHGGNISVDSALGRGSSFYIILPTDPSLIPPKEISI